MDFILKTRCTKGQLVVYEDRISIELIGLGVHKTNSIPFSNITGIEINTTMAKIPLLCVGYANVTVFATGSQKLEVGMVKLDDAKKIEEITRSKLSKTNSQTSSTDELEKLAELKDKGIITQKEFELKKKQILGL